MADGEDMITITIRFLNENIKQDTKISLQTDYGTFEGNNMDMIELMVIDRVATAELKSTNVPNDDVVLTVDVGDVCQQNEIPVAVPALPDFIDFQADRLEISANRSERASLTLKLSKVSSLTCAQYIEHADFSNFSFRTYGYETQNSLCQRKLPTAIVGTSLGTSRKPEYLQS